MTTAPPRDDRPARVTLVLPGPIAEALRRRARLEHRDPRRQAEAILEAALTEERIERTTLERPLPERRHWPAVDSENPSLESDPWP